MILNGFDKIKMTLSCNIHSKIYSYKKLEDNGSSDKSIELKRSTSKGQYKRQEAFVSSDES